MPGFGRLLQLIKTWELCLPSFLPSFLAAAAAAAAAPPKREVLARKNRFWRCLRFFEGHFCCCPVVAMRMGGGENEYSLTHQRFPNYGRSGCKKRWRGGGGPTHELCRPRQTMRVERVIIPSEASQSCQPDWKIPVLFLYILKTTCASRTWVIMNAPNSSSSSNSI